MNIYIDTNVLIAYFFPRDPMYSSAQQIMHTPSLIRYISPVSVLEFGSKMGMLWRAKELHLHPTIEAQLNTVDLEDQIKIIVERCLSALDVAFQAYTTLENYRWHTQNYQIEDTLTLALQLFPALGLRTLDLLHVAYAMKIRLYNKSDLPYFVTNDHKIITQAAIIYQKTRILPILPPDLIVLLK